MPLTVAPFVGTVRETLGGVVSPEPMTVTVAVQVAGVPALLVMVRV